MRLPRMIFVFFLCAISAVCSFADAIVMTHTGVGSGTVGVTSFTDASFTITDVGDTAGRQNFGDGFFIEDTLASISISGIGDFSFITGTRTFVNNSLSIVGFSRTGTAGADLFNGPASAVFSTWDMLSSIGPISGSAALLQWSLSPVDTSGGVLVFANSTSDTRFTAQVGAVPEPSSLLLLGTILAGAAVTVKRKFVS